MTPSLQKNGSTLDAHMAERPNHFGHRRFTAMVRRGSTVRVQSVRGLAVPASAGLQEERVHVGGELAVVLEEKAVGRVRVDLDPRVREESGQEVRVTG